MLRVYKNGEYFIQVTIPPGYTDWQEEFPAQTGDLVDIYYVQGTGAGQGHVYTVEVNGFPFTTQGPGLTNNSLYSYIASCITPPPGPADCLGAYHYNFPGSPVQYSGGTVVYPFGNIADLNDQNGGCLGEENKGVWVLLGDLDPMAPTVPQGAVELTIQPVGNTARP